MSSTVGKKQNKDSYLKEQRLLKEKAQKNQSTPHIAEPNSTQSKNETADWLSPHILNKTAFDTTRAGTTIQTEVRETHQGEIETSKIQTGDARKEKNIEIKPESLKAFEKTFSEKINQLTDKNKRSSASPETVGTLVERAPQMIPTNQRQKETVNKDEERKLSALKKIQEEAQRLKNIGKTDEAKALLKQAIENPTFYTKYLGQNKDKQGSERALLRESTHKISKEDQEKALASSDIISARNILIEASGSSTEQASEATKEAYLKATEALISGDKQLSEYLFDQIKKGNLDEANKAYQEYLHELSPEQAIAKLQSLHTGRITENARKVEVALKKNQEETVAKMTANRRPMANCIDCHPDKNQGINLDLSKEFERLAHSKSSHQDLKQLLESLNGLSPETLEELKPDSENKQDPSLNELLEERAKLLEVQLEVTELTQQGKIEMANALFSGEISIDDVNESKLRSENPYATRLTAVDGSEMSDEEMVAKERERLQEVININRMSIAHLEGKIRTFDQQTEAMPVGKTGIDLEQRTMMRVQQEQLVKETQRLFQAHDQVTQLANSGDYKAARDILEGRKSIINEDQEPEKNQNAEKLAGREFKRTPPEKEKYQITTQTLRQLKDVQAGHENLEGGVKKNLKQTNKDLEENDDWISSWGGLTEQLRNQRDAEKNRLNGFDKQRRQIDELKTAADSLIKQGKYEDATELLKKTTDFASTAFQESNSNLIKDYKTINEELSKFDEKLKDASVTVAKNVAIGTVAVGVALALAPATGGLSLMAAGTMIGGGALAGFGVGLVTDLADAGVDMAVFDQTAGEAFKDFGTKQLQNARLSLTAASSATGTAGLSRILIARGFGAYGSAGLSASVSAPVTTTANFGIDRGLAELKYQNLSESQKAAYGSYDEFLKKESVDLNTLGRKLTVDTSIEVLGSLTGVKLESLFKAGKGAAKEINKEAVEALSKSITKDLAKHGLGTDIVYGLLAAQLTNPEGITSQDVAQNILQALTGRKIGEFTAKTFESRRNKNNPELQGVIESHKLKAGIDAQTRVRYDNQGNLLSADVEARPELIQKALNGDSIAQAKIKEESLVHALQKPIDPRITADGKVMPANHYKALRAQRELQSQAIADRLQAESETGSISKQRKNNNEAITKINQLIDAEQFDEAIKIAGNNGIDENYLDQYAEDYKHNIDPNRKYIEETNYSSNQTDTTTKNDTKSPPEIDQLINQIDDVDKLTDEQRQRLSSQLDALDTSTLSISEKADLAYLTGKLNGNPEQRLGYEVDLAISEKYRESDNDPKVVTDHVEALAPKIEAQIAELQKLQKDGADDKTLAEAFGKLERLGLEMSAIRGSETVGLIAKDVQISSQVKDLDSYNTGRLAQGLRNPELQADARIKAEGFISDLALKPEDIKAREDAIGEIDSIALELYQGKLENSPEVSKQVQTIVDSINPNHLNQAKINQINSMVQEIKNNGTIGQLDQLTYDIYRGRTELTPEALNKIQSLADSIDKDSLSSQKAQQLQSIIDRKTQATINKLDEIFYELKSGTAEYKPEIADKFQSLIDSMNPNDLSSENIQKINSLINEIKSSAKDSGKPIPNNLSVIRASNDLAPGIEAQTTVKYFKNGDITVDSSARPELIARARNGDSKALAISKEEKAHGNKKPLDPLYKLDGSPRKDPLNKQAYSAIRAQTELAMQVKGKALQAQAEGNNVSSVKQGTKEALIKMTDAIKAGNYAEALAIAEKNGVGEIYIEQFGRDYDHNVNPKRTHLEETSFSADTIYDSQGRRVLTNEKEAIKSAQELLNNIIENYTDDDLLKELRNFQHEIKTKHSGSGAKAANELIATKIREIEATRIEASKSAELVEQKRQKADDAAAITTENKLRAQQKQAEIDLIHEKLKENNPNISRAAAERIFNDIENSMQALTNSYLTRQEIANAVVSDTYPIDKKKVYQTLGKGTKPEFNKKLNRMETVEEAEISAGKGKFNELRLRAALEKLMDTKNIDSYQMAKGGKKYEGLDALGVDGLVKFPNGDVIALQAKSSPAGVIENYTKEVTYHESQKTGHSEIKRRGNNPINITDKSLTELTQIISNLKNENPHILRTEEDLKTIPSGHRGSIIFTPEIFGNPLFNPGNTASVLNKTQTEILERAIIDR